MWKVSTQDNIYGKVEALFVQTGNATAEVVGTILIPLAQWLGLYWVIENPAASMKFGWFLMNGFKAHWYVSDFWGVGLDFVCGSRFFSIQVTHVSSIMT